MWDIFIKWLIPFLCGGAVSALGVVIGRIKLGKRNKTRSPWACNACSEPRL